MAKTTKPIPNHTTGRQRGESSRPVGKYSGRKMAKMATMGAKVQPNYAPYRPPGSDPGALISA